MIQLLQGLAWLYVQTEARADGDGVGSGAASSHHARAGGGALVPTRLVRGAGGSCRLPGGGSICAYLSDRRGAAERRRRVVRMPL
jgi:hypothetical protein